MSELSDPKIAYLVAPNGWRAYELVSKAVWDKAPKKLRATTKYWNRRFTNEELKKLTD